MPMVHEVARVFDEVLRRPRFQFFTKEDESRLEYVRFTVYANREKFKVNCYDVRHKVHVVVTIMINGYNSSFFITYFDKSHPKKMRKEALILAKKIMMKPLYDIMEK